MMMVIYSTTKQFIAAMMRDYSTVIPFLITVRCADNKMQKETP